MDFAYTDKVRELQGKVQRFMDDHVYPAEQRHHDDASGQAARAADGPGAKAGARHEVGGGPPHQQGA